MHDATNIGRGRIESPADMRAFVLAGNATFTLVSERTGQRFTFRVRVSDDGRAHFVAVLTGPDNGGDYSYLGTIRNGRYWHGRRSRIGQDAPSARAFAWFAARVIERGRDAPGMIFMHEGRCGRCARKLTVPESIARGLGPECAGYVALECDAIPKAA